MHHGIFLSHAYEPVVARPRKGKKRRHHVHMDLGWQLAWALFEKRCRPNHGGQLWRSIARTVVSNRARIRRSFPELDKRPRRNKETTDETLHSEREGPHQLARGERVQVIRVHKSRRTIFGLRCS